MLAWLPYRRKISANSIQEDGHKDYVTVEFLNSLTPSRIPDHNLKLKVGAPVFMLRNLQAGHDHILNNAKQHHLVWDCNRHKQGETIFLPYDLISFLICICCNKHCPILQHDNKLWHLTTNAISFPSTTAHMHLYPSVHMHHFSNQHLTYSQLRSTT